MEMIKIKQDTMSSEKRPEHRGVSSLVTTMVMYGQTEKEAQLICQREDIMSKFLYYLISFIVSIILLRQ